MKQIIVNIPEQKLPFFQELIDSLGYESYSQESPITPTMEAAIDAELKKIEEDPAYLLKWGEARKTLRRSGNYA